MRSSSSVLIAPGGATASMWSSPYARSESREEWECEGRSVRSEDVKSVSERRRRSSERSRERREEVRLWLKVGVVGVVVGVVAWRRLLAVKGAVLVRVMDLEDGLSFA